MTLLPSSPSSSFPFASCTLGLWETSVILQEFILPGKLTWNTWQKMELQCQAPEPWNVTSLCLLARHHRFHVEARQESSLAVGTVRLLPGFQEGTSPTDLSTVTLAKPQEWERNRNVSEEKHAIRVLSPKFHTHIPACLVDISS